MSEMTFRILRYTFFRALQLMMYSIVLCSHSNSVRPFVCLSYADAAWYCDQMDQVNIARSSSLDSPIILVFCEVRFISKLELWTARN